jgi:hypothetical protein
MDLEAHRSGVVNIVELIEEELRVKVVGELVLTFVVLAIRGTIDGADASGRYRYTRTWTRAAGDGRSSEPTSVRQAEAHRGASARSRLRDDRPAVGFDDPPADREADAAARIVAGADAFEHRERVVAECRWDPDAVVLDGEHPEPVRVLGRHLDSGGSSDRYLRLFATRFWRTRPS